MLDFTVTFQSPLLIGGGETNGRNIFADPQGLTGKALRGAWRFWFRALWGGLGKNANQCYTKESEIFGSTNHSCLRMQIFPQTPLESKQFPTLPDRATNSVPIHPKSAPKEGYDAGCSFEVKIESRGNFSSENTKILKASIALWSCLGGIGARSRRGFGSPRVDSVQDFPSLNLESPDSFRESLTGCLNEIRRRCTQDILKEKFSWDSRYSRTGPYNFFQLRSLDQVFISQSLGNNLLSKGGVLDKIHGSHIHDDLGYSKKIKKQDCKFASPYYLRIFHLDTKEYVAVCTFCPERDPQNLVSWPTQKTRSIPTTWTFFSNSLAGNQF